MQKTMSSKGRWVKLLQGLPRVRAWLLWATFLGLAVLLYCAYLAVSYTLSANEAKSLDKKVAVLTEGLGAPAASQASPAQAEVAEQRLKAIEQLFKRHDSEALAGMVYDAADTSGVEVNALFMGKVSAKVEDGVQYQLQPLTLNINGSSKNVVQFLAALRQRYPAVAVTDGRLSGSGAGPAAQIQLVLYISPQAVSKTPAVTK